MRRHVHAITERKALIEMADPRYVPTVFHLPEVVCQAMDLVRQYVGSPESHLGRLLLKKDVG
jgi:hypothetical protein